MTTKLGVGIVFRKAQVFAKFHCPTSTVTLFSEDGEGRIHSSLVIESQKRLANSGGTIVYNYPCSCSLIKSVMHRKMLQLIREVYLNVKAMVPTDKGLMDFSNVS